jgi:hypothetical protein
MVQKHIIVSMIAPVAMAGILIMAILANQAYASSKSESSSSEKCKTTENGNSQGEENCKTAQGENTEGGKVAQESNTGKEVKESSNTGKEVKESSNTGNTEGSNNHAQESSKKCFNEHTKKWEPCVVKNSPQKQESSNTPSSQESSKTEQSSVPITITPQFTIKQNAHMTATNEQLSKNGKLTEKNPTRTEEIVGAANARAAELNARAAKLCSKSSMPEYMYNLCLKQNGLSSIMGNGARIPQQLQATEDCHKTSGGSYICLPKRGTNVVVERANHTGNLYNSQTMREKAATERKEGQINPSAQGGCAVHTSLHAFTALPHKSEVAKSCTTHGSALIHGVPGHIAKTIHKTGAETLAMLKHIIRGHKGE